MIVDLSNVRDKLNEATFFFQHLREQQKQTTLQRQQDVFRFYFSAFLNACFSVIEYLEKEAKGALKAGASSRQQSKRQAKGRFTDWFTRWSAELPPEDRAVWNFMIGNRGAEVHVNRVKTTKEAKAVPADGLSGSARDSSYFYRPVALYAATFSAGDEVGDPLIEERKRLGLPSWCNAWTYLDAHYVEINGDRVLVVETCERFLASLGKLIMDFERADWN